MKKTSTTERALLANHKPNHKSGTAHPNPQRWLYRSLYTSSHSCTCLISCLSFSNAIGTQKDTGLAGARWSNKSASLDVTTLPPP
uniref:Uncharacterized protein n=1 Tax=Mesocestoides corti TaxID=53468 RepID=A0A5K3FTW9_MESCO